MYIQNMFMQHTCSVSTLHTQVTHHEPHMLAHTAFTMTIIPSVWPVLVQSN